MSQSNVLNPHKVLYPKSFSFWQEMPQEKNLQIINPGDFPLATAMAGIGIKQKSLGGCLATCDETEIRARQGTVKFLMENPKATEWLNSAEMCTHIPTKECDFLRFYNPNKPHNYFWARIHEFLEICNQPASLPSRMQTFVNALRQSLPLEDCENAMASQVAQRVQSMAIMEGIVEYPLKKTRAHSVVVREKLEDDIPVPISMVGYTKYSFSLADVENLRPPKWIYNKRNPLNWVGIGKLAKLRWELAKAKMLREAYKEAEIKTVSCSLANELNDGVKEILNEKIDWLNVDFDEGTVKVRFRYGPGGLEIYICSIEKEFNEAENVGAVEWYEGFALTAQNRLTSAKNVFDLEIKRQKQLQFMAELKNHFVGDKNIIHCWLKISSECTDSRHKWFAITNLYNSEELRTTHQALLEHREFVKTNFEVLKELATAVSAFQKTAEKEGSPLCLPEILDGEHMVSFENLFPVHLMGRNENLVPISGLPQLNGTLLGLTGFDGGGKTVTSLAIPLATYLAQCGFPVFASQFSLNVKKVLGMVFIERGERSTCEMLVEKLTKVLGEALQHKGNEVILVLDELGSATQEQSGFELGCDVLKTVQQHEISTIFSTQIQDLAQFAQEELGAQCFQLNSQHQIFDGIGDGGMAELRKRSGLDKLLKK